MQVVAAVLAAVLMGVVHVEYATAGSKFQYFGQAKTFSDAEKACVALGGHLASISSDVQNNDVFHTSAHTLERPNARRMIVRSHTRTHARSVMTPLSRAKWPLTITF